MAVVRVGRSKKKETLQENAGQQRRTVNGGKNGSPVSGRIDLRPAANLNAASPPESEDDQDPMMGMGATTLTNSSPKAVPHPAIPPPTQVELAVPNESPRRRLLA